MARMKVLLMEDVPNLGLAGDIQTVAAGFARNYLIPRQEVVPASKGAVKQAEDIRQAAIRRRAKDRANSEAQAIMIGQQKLLFEVRAGDNNRLYGSITSGDVAEQLEGLLDFEIDRRRIQLDSALRDLGLYDISIRLMPEVAGTFKVAVVREGEGWADAEKRQAEEIAAAQAAAEKAAADALAIKANEAAQAEAQEDEAQEEDDGEDE
jgi:large subunit ribosomal protein L9